MDELNDQHGDLVHELAYDSLHESTRILELAGVTNEAQSANGNSWAVFDAKNFAFDTEMNSEKRAARRAASYERDGGAPGAITYAPMDEYKKMAQEYKVNRVFKDWMNSEYAPYKDDAGDENEIIRNAKTYINNTPPSHHGIDGKFIDKYAKLLADRYHGISEGMGTIGTTPTIPTSNSARILQLAGVTNEAQSAAQKAAFKAMIDKKNGKSEDTAEADDEEKVEEATEETPASNNIYGQGVYEGQQEYSRILELAGLNEWANSPQGKADEKGTVTSKLPSNVGQGGGNSQFGQNRANGQGENPMGMSNTANDSAIEVEEAFKNAMGEYRKFVSEAIANKK
jgi:hypothetical protein